MERYVWINSGAASFERFMHESSLYYPQSYAPYLAQNARWLGVASRGYRPSQSYFSNTLGGSDRYLHPYYSQSNQRDAVPFVMREDIAASFPGLPLRDRDGRLQQPQNAPRASAAVRAIIEARQRPAAPQAGAAPSPDAGGATTAPQTTQPQMSARAAAALEAIRSGRDPSAAVSSPNAAPQTTASPSASRSSAETRVSPRVQAILDARRGQ